MPRISFTPNLERHLSAPTVEAEGGSVREVLEKVFAANPRLGGYIFDEQKNLRQHVVVFVDGEQVRDKAGLSDPVHDGSDIYVMQALSGG